DVHDGEFAWLAGDDGQAVGIALAGAKIDGHVGLFLDVVDLDQLLPTLLRKLLFDELDIVGGIGIVRIKIKTSNVDAFQARDDLLYVALVRLAGIQEAG